MADQTFPMIEVQGFNGETLLRYLKLADGQYYGGVAHSDVLSELPFTWGPHIWVTLGGMLDLVGKIANLTVPKFCHYTIRGGCSGRYNFEAITREMHADRLADILGCDPQAVRDHFEQLVLIPEEPKDAA